MEKRYKIVFYNDCSAFVWDNEDYAYEKVEFDSDVIRFHRDKESKFCKDVTAEIYRNFIWNGYGWEKKIKGDTNVRKT